jgi:hypothetical protein
MRLIALLTAILVLGVWAPATLAPDPVRVADTKDRAKAAFDLLAQVPSGRALIEKAKRLWHVSDQKDLSSLVTWGVASKTDAVLIRHFDPASGEETRERKVTVYLKKNQTTENLVLDLAHELLHAVSRPAWDPYDPKLDAVKYIRAAIEGTGGEVQAVEMECQVALEFAEIAPPTAIGERPWGEESRTRCHRYWNANAAEMIRQDFYSAGKWKSELVQELGPAAGELTLLSDQAPILYSSTGGAPYPSSLYEEFRAINRVACENSRKRAEVFAQSAASENRRPAAAASRSPVETEAQKNDAFLAARCH